ncbi:EF-hand domain-containing protein [Streptomyces sp. ODS28]|uniref:EF-hand domain-containing protein n=1 Tax=Streptomyces sp. ODS28 TaxID=3136688 RepID=UPI0031E7CD77
MADIDAARKTFEKFDRNGDGYVTPVEFQQAMVELGDRHYTVALAEAILKTRDDNGDGVLSFDEFYQRAQEV